jgi:hypothetical protein
MAPGATPLSISQIAPHSPWWIYAAVITVLAIHIGGGSIAILSGYGAVLVRKGGGRHMLFGRAFSGAMLLMGVAGAGLAVMIRQNGNIAGGVLAAYLVATGWMAIRRAPGQLGLFESGAALVAFGTSATLLKWAYDAHAHPTADDPALPFCIFAAFAAFFGALDIKVLMQGGLRGGQRVMRHLWRMCFAFAFAAGSFFVGQQKVMPLWMQGSPVLYGLALAPLAFLIFWLIRVRFGRRFKATALQAAA